ncbi:hypothetical protein IWQ61_001567 [Dispira simplex]|nr:hypothetical protein IWQ61_001567 [Dispira simplex]
MPIRKLLLQNQAWAYAFKSKFPELSAQVAQEQNPSVFWITCADSRVSPELITDSTLSELFVFRNVANIVNGDDLSSMSALEFAVKYLKVQHIVVCGHTNCGGIHSALQADQSFGKFMDPWLNNIRQLTKDHHDQLTGLSDQERFQTVVELNVKRSMSNIARSEAVQRRWEEEDAVPLSVHGLVLRLETLELHRLNPTLDGIEARDI